MSARVESTIPSQGRTLRRLFLTLFLRGRAMRLANQRGASSAANQKKARSIGSRLGIMLFVYAAFGISSASLAGRPVHLLAIFLHALIMLTVGMFVSASAGEVLFNRDETEILQHRPIDPGTMLWSKLAILVQVALYIAGAVSVAGLVVGTAFTPDGGIDFLLAQLLATLLSAVFLVSAITVTYQLCLRWFGRERLDSLMTIVQIASSIIFVGAAQLAPRMMRVDGGLLHVLDAWWVALLPPAWFAGLVDAVGGTHAASSWRLGALGVGMTALLAWVAVRGLSQSFDEGLQKLAERTRRRPARAGGGFLKRLVNAPPLSWWLRDQVERSAFLLTAAHLFRDRDTKLRVYPAIAPTLIMPVVMLGSSRGSTGGMGAAWPVAFAGLYLGIIPFTVLPLLQRSDNWRAVEAFRVTPMRSPATLVTGARRAVLLLLTLPLTILFVVIVATVSGGKAPLALLIPGLLSIPVYAMIPCVFNDAVPFSQAPDAATPAKRTMSTIGILFLDMLLAGGAAFAYTRGLLWWFIGAEAVIVVVCYIVMRHEANRIEWESLG